MGPFGVGISGIFQSMVELVRNGTGLGINFSGVKNVAENNGNPDKVAKTILVLRRWEFGTGLIGTFFIIALCKLFSNYSFGNSNYTLSIAAISITLLINAVSAGQLAILQGLRKIDQMAKATLLGSLLGTIISLPLFKWLGIQGIVPSMILTALGSLSVSWFYARKIKTIKVKMSMPETFREGLGMAKLGFFIVVNGFVATVALYVVRGFIRSHLNLTYVGYFQAVWLVSTMYINVLLNSMLADYFPRLSAIKEDEKSSNELINQQLEMTLLVGAPMLMIMITFATLTINVLYSSAFYPAITVLQWQMMASLFTLISYTIGVLFLAKNTGWQAIISETIRQAVFIAFVFFGWKTFGFNVLGIGFVAANIVCLIYCFYIVSALILFVSQPLTSKI